MITEQNLLKNRVFHYFYEISAIPRGSEDMDKIADYCENFAKKHSLQYLRDKGNNVIIFKEASKGYENAEPIILQGHLDMVCQKEDDYEIDFSNDGIKPFIDGDFIKAEKTTLGADNGIAVSMILAILENDCYRHPKIEAVFTTDEEIGMVGAFKLDMSKLTAKKMLNLDSEEDDVMTVSCAGGADFKVTFPINRKNVRGTKIQITLKGLSGGHSGVEIDKGRVNSNILSGRVLNKLKNIGFSLESINGGTKTNAITNLTKISVITTNPEEFKTALENYLSVIKTEIKEREPDFSYTAETKEAGEFNCIADSVTEKIIYSLVNAPNGIIDMSASIKGLVETSLNLGILETNENEVILHFSLRSNKETALDFLEERLTSFFNFLPCKYEKFGRYPSWEYNNNSDLQELYKKLYEEHYKKQVKVEAIHAGLECGVFAAGIEDFDCISIGPSMFDVHTVNERLSVSSTEKLFDLLIKVLENCK